MNTFAALEELKQAYYESQFRNKYCESNGSAFQDFFSRIMEMRYPSDFVRVRPWGRLGDRKNDGYLASKRMLFQCFAPYEMKPISKCLKKIKEDFNGALPHWIKYFDEWIFTHNDINGLPDPVLELLLELAENHKPIRAHHWGYQELLLEFRGLDDRNLETLLGPAPGMQHVLDVRVEDVERLLAHIALQPEPLTVDVKPVPPEKIRHNQLSSAVALLLRAGMVKADIVKKYLRGISNQTLSDRLAAAFRGQYDHLKAQGLAPDEIFAELQRFITGGLVPTPTAQAAALTILAFFFEACEIFERPISNQEQAI